MCSLISKLRIRPDGGGGLKNIKQKWHDLSTLEHFCRYVSRIRLRVYHFLPFSVSGVVKLKSDAVVPGRRDGTVLVVDLDIWCKLLGPDGR